ncbi:transcriptional regulator [Fructobacillus fructosus]|nr:Rrf2 family transcriptional regulator [Fructobacillus fructosus KCTC 3544]GAP01681.1 transcriptional regulator [Fructobacillus fructosus]
MVMKPSLKLTNAIHILIYISTTDQKATCSSKEIAASVNTNPSRIRALMADLQSAGIIERLGDHFSRPVLAKPAAAISLADVLQAVDPNPGVFPLDNKVSDDCPIAQQVNPVLSTYYEEIDRALIEKMAEINLENILQDVNQRAGTNLCVISGVSNEK